MAFARAREEQEIIHDAFQPKDFSINHFRVGRFLAARLKFLLLNEESGLDRGKRIADFVRHACRQYAERGELFLSFTQRLTFDQFNSQRHDHVAIDDHPQGQSK